MPAIIDRGDRLALYLSTEERPIVPQGAFDEQDCLPQSHALPAIAIPCTVRHRLIGFVLYGAHINGAQPDKKDVELLREIVERATAAYDHVAVVERTNENRELRAEIELLGRCLQVTTARGEAQTCSQYLGLTKMKKPLGCARVPSILHDENLL